jgi:hypothetical protein
MNELLIRVAMLMRPFNGMWGVAGGWAIDLSIGRQTRTHADIDVAILRDDQRPLRELLGDADVAQVVDGQLVPCGAEERLELPIHEIHAKWPDHFRVEFLLNERDRAADEWVFRRDARVRRALDVAFVRGRYLPYLAPELVLLFKSNDPSPKNDADFATVRPRLSVEQCSWLAGALATAQPTHRWIAQLS